MADLILEPYVIRQQWKLHRADIRWEVLIGEFLETIARRCHVTGTCVIGHIKALALFPNGGYLRVSVVSPGRPADAEGDVPPGCDELVLDLNVIVYGPERGFLKRIMWDAVAEVTERLKGGVEIRAM
jgi:hypothetical protein